LLKSKTNKGDKESKMKKLFQTLAVLIAIMLPLVLVLGCGEEEEAAPPGKVTVTDPTSGSEMPANGTIKVTFDNAVKDVKFNGNAATTGSGKSWSWNATGLTAGQDATITIEWTNDDDSTDSTSITLKIKAEDTTAPELVESTPEKGAKDVDYDKINEDAVITLKFNEVIAKADVALMVDDETMKWKVKEEDTDVILEKLSGGELSAETEYCIKGTVKDGADNEAEIEVCFTTKAKEE
jgi:hypothetical protein